MANVKRQFVNGVTPKGEARYAFIRKVETYEGQELGYSIQITFDEKTTKEFKEYLEQEFEKAKESYELKPGKKWSSEPSLGMHTLNDGTITFKFKAKKTYKTKAGEEMTRTIPVVDAKGHPIKASNLGNGSIIRVAFSLSPYWMSNNNNGLACYLRGVQVLKYIPYGGTDAASLGFNTNEEGYDSTVDGEYDKDTTTSNSPAVEEDDVPFDEEGDF